MNFENEDYRWSEQSVYFEKGLINKKSHEAIKEYFCIVMRSKLKLNEQIDIEEISGSFLITAGNEKYVMIDDGIYKCKTFYQLKCKFMQNCIAALHCMISQNQQ